MIMGYVLGAGFTLIGGFFVVFGHLRWSRSRRWPKVAATVTGVRSMIDGDPGGTSTSSPVVTFEVAGRTVQAESAAFDNMHSYRPGRTFPVRYDPERPERAVVDIAGQNGLLHQAIGLLLFLAGVGLLVALVTYVG
jgi:hypothetical protein